MKAVIQRVAQATVAGGGTTEMIGRGLCVLLGYEQDDDQSDEDHILKKILNLKIFPHDEKRWGASVIDIGGDILLISQFTLNAVYKGNRPSFHRAQDPEIAEEAFYGFANKLRKEYRKEKVKNCIFGSYMNVSLVNDGPVTLIFDSKNPKGG